jgi:hypothetical protein
MSPTLSVFHGIAIRMYADEHNPPHFHAMFSGKEAAFDFDGEIIQGDFPKKQTRLVQAWVELHRDEIEMNWHLLTREGEYHKIEPLK